MTDLRKAARGRECQLRLPLICNHDPATTVLCHIRRGNTAGKGQKPNDLLGVVACSACHDELDRRTWRLEQSELDRYLIDGWARTIDMWAREGLIGGKRK